MKTDKGDIVCEHVVSATGNFVRRTGAMVGLDIPVIPVEHQYIVTEPHPAIQERRRQGLPEMGVLREADSSWYMREEAGGLLLGPYEKGAPVCYVDGPSDESEYELFQEDLERLMPHIETAIARVPAFGEVGIKKVYNGAIAYTPDGSPIVGPAWDLKNFWLNEGHSFGVTAAGGAGWQLAEWIVEGEPSIDMMGVDPRRFGPYASRGYLKVKNEEAYANVFTPHYPGRGARRGAAAEDGALLRPHEGARRGVRLGLWLGAAELVRAGGLFGSGRTSSTPTTCSSTTIIAPPDHTGRVRERWSFRRSNYFEHVGNECRNVTEDVGLQDMSAFAKCYVSGPGAEAWLDSLMANRIPKTVGRINLCHMLTQERRRALGVHRLSGRGRRRFYLVSAGALERHDHDYLMKAAADRRQRPRVPGHDRVGRAGARRPAVARRAAEAHRHRPLQQGVPLAVRQEDQCRACRGACAAGEFRRRARLGAASSDRDAEHDLRPADGGGRGVRHQAVRHPGDDRRWRSRNPTG